MLDPITTREEYDAALKKLSDMMEHDPEPDTDAGRELNSLVIAIQKFEDEFLRSAHTPCA
jgi:antitoxin component HigA of HigAB toxin-antitoxin module